MKMRIISTLALLGSVVMFCTSSMAGEGGLHFAEKNIAIAAEFREKKKIAPIDTETLQAQSVEAKT